ncbi:hypothetical protein GGX14DRAFT_485604, partial [Mycena pura]
LLSHSCSHCHKMNSSSEEPGLRKCSGCRRLAYCNNGTCHHSTPSETADWRHHKAFCQTIQLVEKDTEATREMAAAYSQAAQNDLETLNLISIAHSDRFIALCTKLLQRPLTLREIDVIAYEPKCLAWYRRTNMVLQTEARMAERCKMAFSCCDEHWRIARARHQAPCDTLPGTVSQCDRNLELCADADYGAVLTAAQEGQIMWRIIKRQAAWSALTGRTWEEVVGSDVASAAAGTAFALHVPAFTRRVSSLQSTAFTILYALEQLNIGTAWTEKSELTINMLIADPSDFDGASFHEAILHRAPKVKKVTFYFFLPIGIPGAISSAWASEICRRYFNHLVQTRTFESFVHNEAELFVQARPLHCAEQQRSLAAREPAQWRSDNRAARSRGVSQAFFTTASRRHAESGQAVLRECGAELVPSLSGVRNPFGDMRMKPNYNVVHGFHGPNAWFAGGFR